MRGAADRGHTSRSPVGGAQRHVSRRSVLPRASRAARRCHRCRERLEDVAVLARAFANVRGRSCPKTSSKRFAPPLARQRARAAQRRRGVPRSRRVANDGRRGPLSGHRSRARANSSTHSRRTRRRKTRSCSASRGRISIDSCSRPAETSRKPRVSRASKRSYLGQADRKARAAPGVTDRVVQLVGTVAAYCGLIAVAGGCTRPKPDQDPAAAIPAPPPLGPSCERSPACSMSEDMGDATSCCESLWVPGGSYQMGFDPGEVLYAAELEAEDRDHLVTVSGYFLDRFEITWARFEQFAAEYGGPPAAGTGAHPLCRRRAGNPSGISSCPKRVPIYSTAFGPWKPRRWTQEWTPMSSRWRSRPARRI